MQGLLTPLENLECRSSASMCTVEDDAYLIALVYDEFADPAQSAVGAVETPVAELVVSVVGEEHYP